MTYYWPPAGGPGVQRWLKFAKYLPEFGISPVVYVPANPTYPIIDEGLLNEVPRDAIVLKRNILEPYQLASLFSKHKTRRISSGLIPHQKKQFGIEKLLLWIRGNVFIPDARVLWLKPSVRFLSKYLRDNAIDTIITSGPPHSLHLIGLELKSKHQLKWIADFRDPWTTIGYHKSLKLSAYAARRHKALEKKVLDAADTIIVTSNTTQQEFAVLTQTPITVITNGYDIENVPVQPLDSRFTIAHIGSFLSERNPLILWEVLQELTNVNPDFAADFELKLIGAVSAEVLEAIDNHGLRDNVCNHGYLSHKEAIMEQRRSQLLLLIEIDSPATKSIIPGKLFEYMAAERPIIGLGPEGADFAEILKQTNTGLFIKYDQKALLKDSILAYYNAYKSKSLTVHPVGLQQYSRKNLTQKLADLIRS